MDIFVRPLASLLSFYYDLVPNYAAAITLLTFTVMLLLVPLTLKATRSMLAMQRLSPALNKLKEKHKNDRQKLNEEVQGLFREHKISPLSGCLPLLLQLPVFLILYHVLQGLTHKNDGAADPKSLDKSSHLYRDLVSDGGAMPSFGMDLAKSVLSDHASLLAATPFVALILAMVAFQYIAQRQVSSRAPETDNPQAQQMQVIQKFLPPVFGVFSLGFPAALVLYWTMQSLFRMGQQWAMYRFDPALQTTVATANREVDEFLKEDTGSPKVKKSPTGPSNKSKGAKSAKNGNKKRKGR